ncbi:MAG: GNAT family N-acetyltransferase [Candidatus Eisenbacteria bacterium]|nr:GNAT family N-acetyltransferase [Candidatus Eisenbacteria bacterium]
MARPRLMKPPASEEEFLAYSKIAETAFATPRKESLEYFERTGHDTIRLYHDRGELAGGLVILPMAQWFGGRAVPMGGIAAVAVDPQFRDRGVAGGMMAAAVREMYQRGQVLSTLYPATLPLYRRAGYELAGTIHEIKLPPRDLVERERKLTMEEITPEAFPEIQRAYRLYARQHNGPLDRIRYFWQRVQKPFGMPPTRGYAIRRGRKLEGYVYAVTKPQDQGYQLLRIFDYAVLTPAAMRRLLTFIADHRTLCESAIWYGTPSDPLLLVMAEHTYRIRLLGQWMLRIVDLAGALEARGYPRGVKGRVQLRVRDEILRANNGAFVLEVEGGRARVRPGGKGSVKLHIRSLAPLYSGHMTPEVLAAAGQLEATPRQMATLTSIFAGPAPWMADLF